MGHVWAGLLLVRYKCTFQARICPSVLKSNFIFNGFTTTIVFYLFILIGRFACVRALRNEGGRKMPNLLVVNTDMSYGKVCF